MFLCFSYVCIHSSVDFYYVKAITDTTDTSNHSVSNKNILCKSLGDCLFNVCKHQMNDRCLSKGILSQQGIRDLNLIKASIKPTT